MIDSVIVSPVEGFSVTMRLTCSRGGAQVMKRIGSNKVVADGRCTFTLRCEPRLLINAFAEARKEGVPFSDWFEAAIRNQLPGIRRTEASRPDVNRVDRFC